MPVRQIGALLFLAVLLSMEVLSVTSHIDIAAVVHLILLLLVCTVAASLAVVSPFGMCRTFLTAGSGRWLPFSIDTLGSMAVFVGLWGTFICLVSMLANLEDMEQLLPAIAQAMVPFITGVFVQVILRAFDAGAHAEPPAASPPPAPAQSSALWVIIGIVLFLGSTYVYMARQHTSLALFIDVYSILLVLPGGFAAALLGASFKDLLLPFTCGCTATYTSIDEARTCVRMSNHLYNQFTAFGFIGSIIGIILMSIYLDNPDALGPGMAVALITLFHATGLNILMIAMHAAARRYLLEHNTDETPAIVLSPVMMGILALGLCLSSFFILVFSFSKTGA